MTMNFRNHVFNTNGTIDCEVEHPVYGWIPFTASENDLEQHGRDVFAAAQATAAPYVAPPPEPDPAPEELLEEKRNSTYIPRHIFLINCAAAGIISQSDAEIASDGSWPPGFDIFLQNMTFEQRIEAKSRWKDIGQGVWRMSPLLELVAHHKLGGDDQFIQQQLDLLFGIE